MKQRADSHQPSVQGGSRIPAVVCGKEQKGLIVRPRPDGKTEATYKLRSGCSQIFRRSPK